MEKAMATHSNILAWRIPGTEEPVGLPSMRSYRVGCDWGNLAAAVRLTNLAAPHLCQYLFLSVIWTLPFYNVCFPGGRSGKESACQFMRHKRHGFDPWVGKIPWRRKLQPTPVFLPGKFHGQRSLVGYSLWSCKELDTTEHIHTHT